MRCINFLLFAVPQVGVLATLPAASPRRACPNRIFRWRVAFFLMYILGPIGKIATEKWASHAFDSTEVRDA